MSQAAKYTIDPAHSTAGFKVRHLMVANVRGEFTKVSGTVTQLTDLQTQLAAVDAKLRAAQAAGDTTAITDLIDFDMWWAFDLADPWETSTSSIATTTTG